MQTLKTDLKRSLTSWGLIVGIIGMALMAFFGAFEQILPILQGDMKTVMEGFSIQTLLSSLSSDAVLMALLTNLKINGISIFPYSSINFLNTNGIALIKDYLLVFLLGILLLLVRMYIWRKKLYKGD